MIQIGFHSGQSYGLAGIQVIHRQLAAVNRHSDVTVGTNMIQIGFHSGQSYGLAGIQIICCQFAGALNRQRARNVHIPQPCILSSFQQKAAVRTHIIQSDIFGRTDFGIAAGTEMLKHRRLLAVEINVPAGKRLQSIGRNFHITIGSADITGNTVKLNPRSRQNGIVISGGNVGSRLQTQSLAGRCRFYPQFTITEMTDVDVFAGVNAQRMFFILLIAESHRQIGVFAADRRRIDDNALPLQIDDISFGNRRRQSAAAV